MNLLEHYIKEIHSEEVVPTETLIKKGWTDLPKDYIYLKIDVTTNCYGLIKRKIHYASKKVWEAEKAKGYYLE